MTSFRQHVENVASITVPFFQFLLAQNALNFLFVCESNDDFLKFYTVFCGILIAFVLHCLCVLHVVSEATNFCFAADSIATAFKGLTFC